MQMPMGRGLSLVMSVVMFVMFLVKNKQFSCKTGEFFVSLQMYYQQR